MKKIQLNTLNLDILPTYFTDISTYSPNIFKITECPKTLTSGKNLIKLQGTPEIIQTGTTIEVEVLDYNRDPIYTEILDYIDDDGSRVISIYVYDDTSNGDATITLVGQVTSLYNPTNSQYTPVPDIWLDKPNVKWIKTLPVNPTVPNNTEVIFTEDPTVTIEEQIGVRLDRSFSTGTQFPTYTTGTVKFINKNNQPAMILKGGEFNSDMKDGTITVSAPTNPSPTPIYPLTAIPAYSSKIKKVNIFRKPIHIL